MTEKSACPTHTAASQAPGTFTVSVTAGGYYTVQVFVTSTLGQTADSFTIINP